MLQRDHLFEWRTIYQNVILGLELNHTLTQQNREYVLKLLADYGLAAFKDKKPSELSGGMRQRAALIRTMAALFRGKQSGDNGEQGRFAARTYLETFEGMLTKGGDNWLQFTVCYFLPDVARRIQTAAPHPYLDRHGSNINNVAQYMYRAVCGDK